MSERQTSMRKIDFHAALMHCVPEPETPVAAFDREVETIRRFAVTQEIRAAALRSGDPTAYIEDVYQQVRMAELNPEGK